MKTTKKLKRMVAGVLASLMAMSGTANICAADTEEKCTFINGILGRTVGD